MFGYVTADFTKLSKSEKKEYKSAYCGLCRTLAARYGARARFLLSFDTTFALLVLSCAKENKECKTCACPYHFGAKRTCLCGDICDYMADVTVLLACMNFDDDIKDERSLRARLLKRIFTKCFEKAKKQRPGLYSRLKDAMYRLDKAEKADERDPNVPADIFGGLLCEVFSYDERLSLFGFYLGRFIYLCDAVCDFKSDIKKGRYNPLVGRRSSEFESLLVPNIEACIDILARLGIENKTIDNVLEYGVWLRYTLKYKRTV